MKYSLLFSCLFSCLITCGGRCIDNNNNTEKNKSDFDTISANALGIKENSRVLVDDFWDLQNKTLYLPPNVTLIIGNGIITNGRINGNHTKIEGRGVLFNKISISGSWHVPYISTSLFADLNYNNSLKDLFALTCPEVYNRVIVEKGDYYLSAAKDGDCGVLIESNTDVMFKGVIHLLPNCYEVYDIVKLTGYSISINGSGSIVGDKRNHKGKAGEWGMGIRVDDCHNVLIKGINISECWGDCIYIGGSSTNVSIEDCTLHSSRRQGISITSADGVLIRNCQITNIKGTSPEYAIDIEPNEDGKCDNIIIENVGVRKCKGGFATYGKANKAYVGRVVIRDSSPFGDGKPAISIIACNSLLLEDCIITQKNIKRIVECEEVSEAIIKNNTFVQRKRGMFGFNAFLQNSSQDINKNYIKTDNCKSVTIINNTIK